MRTFKLTLAYDGTNYAGWQFQPGCVTLQETLETALQKITGEFIRVTASGRTDAGVHALGQVVGFRSGTHLEPSIIERALNAELPRDMAVLEVIEAPPGFHATGSVLRKRYRYVIADGMQRDVFSRHFAWHRHTRLDDAAMARAAQALVGTHDFSSFESSGSQRQTSVRTVFECAVRRIASVGIGPGTHDSAAPPIAGQGAGEGRGAELLTVEVEADGFLYNMVRTIVGTLIEVGRHRQSEAWPGEVLRACDRKAAGQTAPPHGLFLVRVDYQATPVESETAQIESNE